MRYHCAPMRMAKIQNPALTKCRGGCGAAGTLIHCRWERSHFRDNLTISYKTKHTPMIGSSNSTPWHLPRGAEHLCSHTNLHIGIYWSIIQNCNNVEATKMSFVSEGRNELRFTQTME